MAEKEECWMLKNGPLEFQPYQNKLGLEMMQLLSQVKRSLRYFCRHHLKRTEIILEKNPREKWLREMRFFFRKFKNPNYS